MYVLTLALLYFHFKSSLSETVPLSTCKSDTPPQIEDYYWRDYSCIIPHDALPGGLNSQGHVTYIGQVLHQNQIIPAKLDPDEGQVTYEWGYVEHIATENIKILCSRNFDQFEWVQTGNRIINGIRDKRFIVAGYEPGITLLVGRKLINGELVIGKVVFGKGQSTLNTTKNGTGTQHAEFEVLAYKPRIGQSLQTSTSQTSPSKCKPSKTVVINYFN